MNTHLSRNSTALLSLFLGLILQAIAIGQNQDGRSADLFRMNSIAEGPDETMSLNWEHGRGPFAVQHKASLSDTNWTNERDTTLRAATVPASADSGYFRVVDRLGAGDDADAYLTARFNDLFVQDTSAIVRMETYRDGTPGNEERVLANLELIRAYLQERVDGFNAGQRGLFIEPFEWREAVEGAQRWVFGFRLGDGPRKFSILTHLDTVPPGEEPWDAFEPRVETRAYRGAEQPFLTGRGSIDDKAPAIVALSVLEAAAHRFDGTDSLADWTLEVSFDTEEETDFTMGDYFDAVGIPEFGIVFDAIWAIRAEKGIHRSVFGIPLGPVGDGQLWIGNLETAAGSLNQIADFAVARIDGAELEALDALADQVDDWYQNYGFDGPAYHRAPLEVSRQDGSVLLKTLVEGAQHGSAPAENRADGANPLVSLLHFLSSLVDDGTLAVNGYAQVARFAAWGWGTRVFGESHPDLLASFDDVFEEGNGTSYALTRLTTEEGMAKLGMDVRYALGHHSAGWDGVTEGQLPGGSRFPEIFAVLVERFQEIYPQVEITVSTRADVAPDLRDTQGERFQHVSRAYTDVMGEPCPEIATGGGSDAKGYPSLIAAGALFSEDLGPPINYHGIDEGAPIEDLHLSARILWRILLREVEVPPGSALRRDASAVLPSVGSD